MHEATSRQVNQGNTFSLELKLRILIRGHQKSYTVIRTYPTTEKLEWVPMWQGLMMVG